MPFLPMQHPEPTVRGDVPGLGYYLMNPNIPCPECGKAGIISLPRNVRGCMRCEWLDLKYSDITFEETEEFHDAVAYVREDVRRKLRASVLH